MEVLKRINANQLVFWCPGCNTHHYIQHEGQPKWNWNGDMAKPTVSPSILCRGTVPLSDAEVSVIMAGGKIETKHTVCHMMVREGRIEYLGDCSHQYAGKTIDMEPFDGGVV